MLAALKEKLNELVARMLPNGRTAQLRPVLALLHLITLRSNRIRPFLFSYMFWRCVMDGCVMDPADSLLLNTSLAKRAYPVNPDAPAVTHCEHSGAFHS